MSPPANSRFLSERCFSADLQAAFCRLSGDFNPIHSDPILARRTLAGERVVHGVHQALAAIETAAAHRFHCRDRELGVAKLKAVFKQPVHVGETVRFYLTGSTGTDCQIAGRVQDMTVCEVSVGWGEPLAAPDARLSPVETGTATELRFDQLPDREGTLKLGLDADVAREMFPAATSLLGPIGIAEILGLSRMVGMHCPGLHSLFSQFAVQFTGGDGEISLRYRVAKTDERMSKAAIDVGSYGLTGQVIAFFRPPPQPQPTMKEVLGAVEPGSFARSVALIAGGSRGLGETTARIIAAGGGLPIITYLGGAADAEAVAGDIRSGGGHCEVLHLDVRNCEPMLAELSARELVPRSLYYLATPRIFGRRRSFFGHELLQEFYEIYAGAFGRLVDALPGSSEAPLQVFYPSSVALDEPMREMAEYAMAKRMGEEVCAFYNRYSERVRIHIERLPRIRTDQTSTLMPYPSEDALAVMLPLVAKVESAT